MVGDTFVIRGLAMQLLLDTVAGAVVSVPAGLTLPAHLSV